MGRVQEPTSVGGMVVDHPGLMRVFDRVGIDYCCNGEDSLAEACAQAGLAYDEVEAEIRAAVDASHEEPKTDWADLDMSGLVDHIESTHHRYLDDEMPRLSALADKVVSVHGVNHPELGTIRDVLRALVADIGPHLMKEEQVLFPMIRELAVATEPRSFHCGSVGNPIRMMRYEHEQVGEMLAEMRRLSADYSIPDDACASYRAFYEGLAGLEADTHLHIHKENNVLFPSVLECEDSLGQIPST